MCPQINVGEEHFPGGFTKTKHHLLFCFFICLTFVLPIGDNNYIILVLKIHITIKLKDILQMLNVCETVKDDLVIP